VKLSVVIPACNEAESISETVRLLSYALKSEAIDHEILVVNDHSVDGTVQLLDELMKEVTTLRYVSNDGPSGFGNAVRYGLAHFTGDCVALNMADRSDDPADLIRFYRAMCSEKLDCVFGSRFIEGGKTEDYPKMKKFVNRMANRFIRFVMNYRYNDTTNAFKLYRRSTIEGVMPLKAQHFDLCIELPLKAIIRGYSYKVLPNSWFSRKKGSSKMRLWKMGRRYLVVLLRCFREKYFSHSKRDSQYKK
jgi:dolichol-phosphate mannosyltransferase